MENVPVITVSFSSGNLGADPEVFARYQKWVQEVYFPLLLNIPEFRGMDNYDIFRPTLQYPDKGSIGHYRNVVDLENSRQNTERVAVTADVTNWIRRDIRDYAWSAAYELIKSYRSGSIHPIVNLETMIESAPFISLEAFDLMPEDEQKYFDWFDAFGSNIFLPLFINIPGLKGYDWYRYYGVGWFSETKERKYPKYLSIIYFENPESFDKFVKSTELATFFRAMRNVFPRGLPFKWYVQYQLVKSWRK
jgi:hypothetical protein